VSAAAETRTVSDTVVREEVNPALMEFLAEDGGQRAGLDHDLTSAARSKS
jgi:hypothetical protein